MVSKDFKLTSESAIAKVCKLVDKYWFQVRRPDRMEYFRNRVTKLSQKDLTSIAYAMLMVFQYEILSFYNEDDVTWIDVALTLPDGCKEQGIAAVTNVSELVPRVLNSLGQHGERPIRYIFTAAQQEVAVSEDSRITCIDREKLAKFLAVVDLSEHAVSSLLYLPPDMRRRRLNDEAETIGMTLEEFHRIDDGWQDISQQLVRA